MDGKDYRSVNRLAEDAMHFQTIAPVTRTPTGAEAAGREQDPMARWQDIHLAQSMLAAYAEGAFPMARSRTDPEIGWFGARRRAVIPLDGLHVARSLIRRLRRERPRVTLDVAFGEVVRRCAERPEADDSWISHRLEAAYRVLHETGRAHSVEIWHEGRLAGGLFGVALGGAFFAESMFSNRPDGSKTALVMLVHQMRRTGFVLLDAQFMTPHLARMGAVELSAEAYRARLEAALARRADLTARAIDEIAPAEAALALRHLALSRRQAPRPG